MPTNNYLKYWRVIRYWAKAKYGLTTPDLDMLFFLYSEEYFNKTKFKEFEEVMSWDVNRFDSLLRDGWIHVWRKRKGKHATLYELTYKAKMAINTIYKKLNGDLIGEHPGLNPLFKVNVSYMDKVYRRKIIEMNEFVKKERE
tara:strand:+ start:4423 stop:4848 length:426 start_codon:yes stop_codon:yes gene_type:complete